MCGIAALFNFKQTVDRERFRGMVGLMSHRGPDDEGFVFVDASKGIFETAGGIDTPQAVYDSPHGYTPRFSFEHLSDKPYNLALGSRRLAILDLSPAGHMPMSNDEGTLWIVHNGEIYNYRDIREELRSKGYTFHSDSDTEVILKAYAEWDADCLSKFNGMWAFCIWDLNKKVLFCARDRMGIKPFYFIHNDYFFAAASEIKPLLQIVTERMPNDAVIADFLRFGLLDHTNETFFSGIHKLPAAHYMFVGNGEALHMEQFWSVEMSNDIDSGVGDQACATVFRDLLTDAVRLRMRSDVPIGSCLSGGLDSSSIVCLANSIMFKEGNSTAGNWQKTFSSCFDDRRFDEREYIREVLVKTHAEENFVFPRKEEFLSELEALLGHQEEPFSSTGVYAQWCVMKTARKRGVTVLLDGQGADEQLAGYRKFYVFYLFELLKRRRYIRTVSEFTAFFLSPEVLRTINVKWGLRYFGAGRRLLNCDALLKSEFLARSAGREVQFGYGGSLGQRIKRDMMMFSLPVLLRYEDKNSMAYSVETRLPFLDYRVIENLASLPLNQKMQNGWTKYVLRNAMKGILPEKVHSRKSKLGFSTPEDEWLRSFDEKIRDTFSHPCFLGEYADMKALRAYLDGYLGKQMFCQSRILIRYFILELWGRMFFAHPGKF